MSVKSSFFYVTVDAVDGEGASVHVYTDVTNDKILMDVAYAGGTYGTQLGILLGNFGDDALVRLLKKMEQAIDRGTRCVNCGHDQEHEGRSCASVYGPRARCECENYRAAFTEPQNGQRSVDVAPETKSLPDGKATFRRNSPQ